jgi:hypothetical protein
MAEAPTEAAAVEAPTLSEVLRTLAGEVDGLVDSYESIVIRQATPTQYVYRAYPDDGAEYEGGAFLVS